MTISMSIKLNVPGKREARQRTGFRQRLKSVREPAYSRKGLRGGAGLGTSKRLGGRSRWRAWAGVRDRWESRCAGSIPEVGVVGGQAGQAQGSDSRGGSDVGVAVSGGWGGGGQPPGRRPSTATRSAPVTAFPATPHPRRVHVATLRATTKIPSSEPCVERPKTL